VRSTLHSVLVTGASSGIGEACTLRLRQAGWRVFAGVRDEEAASRLQAHGVEPIPLDVTNADEIVAAVEVVGPTLHGLVRQRGHRHRRAARARAARRAPSPARGERRRSRRGGPGLPAGAPHGVGSHRPHGVGQRAERASLPRPVRCVEARARGDRRCGPSRAPPVGDPRDHRRAGERRDRDLAQGRGTRRGARARGSSRAGSALRRAGRAHSRGRAHLRSWGEPRCRRACRRAGAHRAAAESARPRRLRRPPASVDRAATDPDPRPRARARSLADRSGRVDRRCQRRAREAARPLVVSGEIRRREPRSRATRARSGASRR
jgi:hypothetical protein